MRRTIPIIIDLFVVTAIAVRGQTTGVPPAFEVASVRAHQVGNSGREGNQRESLNVFPDRLTMRNISLRSCIGWAYHVMESQVSGPDWLNFERYDIAAEGAGPVAEGQLRGMMQTLLADRFKLAFHRQTKELPVYILIVGKNGPKFHESQTDGESSIEPQKSALGVVIQRTPVAQLVGILSNVLGAPVIDQTGLTGRYDITINLMKYIPQQSDTQPDLISMIVTGLQEELGLKLESKKVSLDLLIIDHVEKVPAEN
jgi:uncharacterized protein (TIGR03435 family)